MPSAEHLDLSGNSDFRAAWPESLAAVLGQCRELVHLNLSGNDIKEVGKERLRASWRGQASGLVGL